MIFGVKWVQRPSIISMPLLIKIKNQNELIKDCKTKQVFRQWIMIFPHIIKARFQRVRLLYPVIAAKISLSTALFNQSVDNSENLNISKNNDWIIIYGYYFLI